MIAYIKGTVVSIGENSLILENNGIGYFLTVPGSTLYALKSDGLEVKIYTYMAVREDDISLFGFLTQNELEMFKMLISVSSIGPKSAIGILSSVNADELRMAIAAEDVKLIASAKGIGTKTAQKIVVELKGKIDKSFITTTTIGSADCISDLKETGASQEAISVLEALGFSRTSAVKAINQIELNDGMNPSDIVAAALKIIE